MNSMERAHQLAAEIEREPLVFRVSIVGPETLEVALRGAPVGYTLDGLTGGLLSNLLGLMLAAWATKNRLDDELAGFLVFGSSVSYRQ